MLSAICFTLSFTLVFSPSFCFLSSLFLVPTAMSAHVSDLHWGGKQLQLKYNSSDALKATRPQLPMWISQELLRLLLCLAHFRRARLLELREDIYPILSYCLSTEHANCTPWVRVIASILSQALN